MGAKQSYRFDTNGDSDLKKTDNKDILHCHIWVDLFFTLLNTGRNK